MGLQYTDNLNPCSVRVTNTSRKSNLSSCPFSSIDGRIEFRVDSLVRQTPDEDQRIYRPKHCEYYNKDNSLKTLNDKHHQASSQKIR